MATAEAQVNRQAVATDSDSEDCCWICLGGSEPGNQLELPCACPRPVHLRCLARWNLQSAGRTEETSCRFCSKPIPDWRSSLTPANVKPAMPVMAIKFEGKTYKLKVKPGPEGLRDFKDQVRLLLGFEITDDFEVCFEASLNGEIIKLAGLNSYGAATHCAAITAGERERKGGSSASKGVSSSRSGSRHLATSASSGHRIPASVAAPAASGRHGVPEGLVTAAQQFRQFQESVALASSAARPASAPAVNTPAQVSASQPRYYMPQQQHHQQQQQQTPALPTPPANRDLMSWLHHSHDEAALRAMHDAQAAQPASHLMHPQSADSPSEVASSPPATAAAPAAASGAVPSLGAHIRDKSASTKLPSLMKTVSRMARKTLHRVFPSHW